METKKEFKELLKEYTNRKKPITHRGLARVIKYGLKDLGYSFTKKGFTHSVENTSISKKDFAKITDRYYKNILRAKKQNKQANFDTVFKVNDIKTQSHDIILDRINIDTSKKYQGGVIIFKYYNVKEQSLFYTSSVIPKEFLDPPDNIYQFLDTQTEFEELRDSPNIKLLDIIVRLYGKTTKKNTQKKKH